MDGKAHLNPPQRAWGRLADRTRVPRCWWYPIPTTLNLAPPALAAAHKQHGESVNRTMLSLLGLGAFSVLTVLNTPDRGLLVSEGTVKVPLTDAAISFLGFVVVVPLLLFVATAYLHILYGYWLELERSRLAFNAGPRTERDGQAIDRLPLLFGLSDPLSRGVTAFIFYWMTPAVLGLITWKGCARSGFGAGLFALTLATLVILLFLQIRRCPVRGWVCRLHWVLVVALVALLGLWAVRLGMEVRARAEPPTPEAPPPLLGGLPFAAISRPFNLFGANLRAEYLGGQRLVGANLELAKLGEARLRGALLGSANLQEADLQRTDLRKADLREADLRGADLREANLREADLRDADLRGADLREADLRGAQLRKANLEGADLRKAKLGDAKLGDAALITARLQEADLTDADLTGAKLMYADLTGATLVRAHLWGASLGRALLVNARLEDANLVGAILDFTDFTGATTRGTFLPADRTGARNLTPQQVRRSSKGADQPPRRKAGR